MQQRTLPVCSRGLVDRVDQRGRRDEDMLAAFSNSATQRVLEWPAEARRTRIESLIDSVGLPVSHATRRSGRPYTLVLTKTEELFTREAAARKQAEADLAWLTRVQRPR